LEEILTGGYKIFGVKRERGVILLGRFWTNQIPIRKEDPDSLLDTHQNLHI
jgi:hypothetical protein